MPRPSQRHQMIAALPPFAWAIDPGETCGFARTYESTPLARVAKFPDDDMAMWYGADSLPMDEFLDHFSNSMIDPRVELVVLEEYRVFPDKAMMHSGKTIPTAECIGAIKWIARQRGVPVIEQPASIKRPMAAILKGRGFRSIGHDRHAKDAELHLWYYATRAEREQTAIKAFGSKEPF